MIKFDNLFDLQKVFPTEESCIRYFEERRWKGKAVSPFDPTSQVYFCPSVNKWRCRNTGRYFTVRTGTVYEGSNIPLTKWFWTSCALALSDIPAHQLAKRIGVTPKTALFMTHRLRYGLKHPVFIKDMLKGSVEADETFIGGKNKNRHWDKKVPKCQGRSWKDKILTLVMAERGGNSIAQVVPNTKLKTLEPIIRVNVKKGSNILTDEWYRKSKLSQDFNHQWVNHKKKQYAKQCENVKASTNLAENFNRHLKKMIGNYQIISRKHAQKYMDEFTFRRNTRKYDIQEKFDLALLSMVGKRLTYQQLVS